MGGWRKKSKQRTEAKAEKPKNPESPEQKDQPEKPKKQNFGKNVLSFLRVERKVQPVGAEQPAPEAEQPTPEQQPAYDRAERMRRFARTVLNHVFGEAKAEPARAAATGEKPVKTEPLFAAAEDLQEATEELDETIAEAKEGVAFTIPRAEAADSGYDAPRPFADYRASELIVEKVQRLESQVETSRAASLVAVGLGVIAVIVAGHEYRARKRDRRVAAKDRRETAKTALKQERKIEAQQQAFNRLEQEQVASQARDHREAYYQKLGEFTHHQADATREVNRELQDVIAPVAVERATGQPRSEWQPQQPKAERAPETPAPLVRVEQGDTIERSPSWRSRDAGGVTGGAGGFGTPQVSDPGQAVPSQAPLSPAAIRAEAERKARAARLASNAWLYGTALALAIAAFVLVVVFL